MVDIRAVVMDAIKDMFCTEPEYKIRQCAIKWFDKDILSLTDLEEIDTYYSTSPVALSDSKERGNDDFKDGKAYTDHSLEVLTKVAVLFGGV